MRFGELAGCYSGTLRRRGKAAAKAHSGFEQYTFAVNGTHFIDPTAADGTVSDDTEHQMSLVNEPTGLGARRF